MTESILFEPRLSPAAGQLFAAAVETLGRLHQSEVSRVVRRIWVPRAGSVDDSTELTAALLVLADLLEQGWEMTDHSSTAVRLLLPSSASAVGAERSRIRRQEQVKRREQLLVGSVRRFVRSMERPRLHGEHFRSIFNLMCDGRALADRLRAAQIEPAVDPYVEEVTSRGVCQHTGLRLMDIWRYFRLTWSNQYTSVPGRSICFLVRDASQDCHPVVGIFALSSAVVQIGVRDRALGWHPEVLVERLRSRKEPELGAVLLSVISRGLSELYLEDLFVGGVLEPAQVERPTPELIVSLREASAAARKQHRQSPDLTLKASSEQADTAFWVRRSKSTLFRSKRLLQLAELLDARRVLRRFLSPVPSSVEVGALMEDREGVRAVRRVVRRLKASKVGIALADLTVCGAVPPYSHLLGGKLVAMLAASPEAVAAYRSRYSGAVSEIASALAGRSIRRAPELVFVGTTSLYGVKPNQYTRVTVPCEPLGGTGTIRYQELGHSESFGSSHYRSDTVEFLARAASRRSGTLHVNNVFGEGTSPKLRLVREGLEAVGLRDSRLLQHGRRRVVYGVELASNVERYLLGLDVAPDYRFSLDSPKSASSVIAAYWWERWARSRAGSPERLVRIEAETLTRPVRHGARVQLPSSERQQLLFDET